MSAPARVFHHGPKPVSLTEFRDALVATCPPRFPTARHARPRPIALAVSGGVDSMAMAYLFSALLETNGRFRVADNPAESAFGIVIDHRLRPGSAAEASRVAHELERLGLRAVTKTLDWRNARKDGVDPARMPNLESTARTMRYQALGLTCRHLQATSLFFAHHRDDQHETIMMRLLAGHGYRGLQGIRQSNAIPECYELHGVYKSGLIDDQMGPDPHLSFEPASNAMRRRPMTVGTDPLLDEVRSHARSHCGIGSMLAHLPGHVVRDVDPRAPYLAPLGCEDGGLQVYRPLLHFDKDRLMATCEANHVQWFEDQTNMDPMLTTRNAIRHMIKSSELPKALQKPAILAISKRAERRVELEEAEAHCLLVREAVVRKFDPNVGTLVVELPSLCRSRARARRRFAEARHGARMVRRRTVAAIAVRKLVDFVTPCTHAPPLVNLDNVVDRLFPELALHATQVPPRAFTVAGVAFEPVPMPGSRKWFLSRAPYSSTQPLPERKLSGPLGCELSSWAVDSKDPPARRARWPNRQSTTIWDGRFWIRASASTPAARLHVLPLLPRCVGQLRAALPQTEGDRLERILKSYAPGKVRYSLPALYSVEAAKGPDMAAPTLTLLALPSLGIHVPGLERWVRYEARFRCVDVSLLGLERRGSRAQVEASRRASLQHARRRCIRRAVHARGCARTLAADAREERALPWAVAKRLGSA